VAPPSGSLPSYADNVTLGIAILAAGLALGAIAVIPLRPIRWLLWAALVAVIAVILWLTMGMAFHSSAGPHLNLVPFQEIRRGLESHGGAPEINLVGNVVLFVPVGALVAWLARRGRVLVGLAFGMLFSVAIELTQFGLGRVADIDDVILNTTGALVGAVFAVVWASAVRRRWAGYDEPAGL